MHLLYEEGGEFRVGTVLSHAPASFQIETPHGRRAKVKSALERVKLDLIPI